MDSLNFPDVFGFISEAPRFQAGVIQAAAAVRPPVIQPGQRFDTLVLIQNMADCPAEVTLTVQLPNARHFRVEKSQLVVRVEAAEVGYAAVPVMTAPNLPPGDGYNIGVEIGVKSAAQKPGRIRQGDGGAPFQLGALPERQQVELAQLQKLTFSGKKRGGILRAGGGIETPLVVRPGKPSETQKTKSGWVSLWTMGDIEDAALLLQKNAELFRLRFLPHLKRAELFEPLLQKTVERFEKAGYPLLPFEAKTITRLLVLILEFANISATAQNRVDAGIYYVEPLMAGSLPEDRDHFALPHWVDVMLRAAARDSRIVHAPGKAIAHFAYDALLYDAAMYGFFEVERATGEDLGTADEMRAYTEAMLGRLNRAGMMNFSYTYMPLVLGGVIVQDRVLLPDEKLGDVLNDLKGLLDCRADEQTEDTELIFELSDRIITQSLRKYGSLDSRNR